MKAAVEETGGVRSAKRGIPAALIVFAVAVLSVSLWYLLSFSSDDYRGSYPRPDAPAGGQAPAPVSH